MIDTKPTETGAVWPTPAQLESSLRLQNLVLWALHGDPAPLDPAPVRE